MAQVHPGRMEELGSISKVSSLSAAKRQHVYEGCLWLTIPETNEAMVVTLWESREALEASEAGGYYREQIDKLGEALAGGSLARPTRSASETDPTREGREEHPTLLPRDFRELAFHALG